MPSKRKPLTFVCAQEGCEAVLLLPRALAVKAAATSVGIAGGAALGASYGAGIGVASGGTAATATVPLGLIGGAIVGLAGFVVGDRAPVTVKCRSCGASNRIGRRHVVVSPSATGENDASSTTDPASPQPEPPIVPLPGGQGGHRRMAEPVYRFEQFARRYESHVLPVNRLVDDLRQESGRWMPYLAATYGGVGADVLLLLQSPGPGTDDQTGEGSGLLSAENDDPSAALLAECLAQANLDQERVVVWNAWPWPIPEGRAPTSAQLKDGVEPAVRLLALLPKVRAVVTMGAKASEGWSLLLEAHPHLEGRYEGIASLLTSARGITEGSRHPKEVGVQRVVADLKQAAHGADPLIDPHLPS